MNPNLKLWRLGGKIVVNAGGEPILCDHCPCEEREWPKPPDWTLLPMPGTGYSSFEYLECAWDITPEEEE